MKTSTYIKFTVIGILCFSPLYNNFHTPFNSIELYIICFLFFSRKELNWKFDKNIILISLLFFILLLMGAVDNGINSSGHIIRTARPWIYMILFYFLFRKTIFLNHKNLYWISLGAVIGTLIFAIQNFTRIAIEDKIFYLCPNIIAMPLCIGLSVKQPTIIKKITFIIVFFMAALSQTRGIFLYFLICYLIYYYLLYLRSGKIKTILKAILYLLLTSVLIVKTYQAVEKPIKNYSPYLHYRLYDKVEEIGTNDSDSKRIKAYKKIFDNAGNYLIPHGFYYREKDEWNKKIKNDAVGINDSGYCELIYTFGFIFLTVLSYLYLKYLQKALKQYKQNTELFAISLTLIFIPFALLMGYAIFTSPYTTCFWGILFAMINTYCKKTIKNEL